MHNLPVYSINHISTNHTSGHKSPDKIVLYLIWSSKNFCLDEHTHQNIISYCHPSHEIQLQLVRTTCSTNQEIQNTEMESNTLFLPM